MYCFLIKSNSPTIKRIKNLPPFFTTIFQFTTMSTAGSESDYNLDVEAMVRKVISEMAIKSANDTVVSTETEETMSLSTLSDHEMSYDSTVSKNTEKQKKGRSRSSTSKRKKSSTWNGDWTASFDGCEIATLRVKDDERGNLQISGFAEGPTTGKYAERKNGYSITFRDAGENWIIEGDIEDENTISWSDGTQWDKIPAKDVKFSHYADVAIAGATPVRALPDFDSDPEGLNGRWRSTFDGDELAVVTVKDDLDEILTIKGFMGGNTCGKYVRNSADRIAGIHSSMPMRVGPSMGM